MLSDREFLLNKTDFISKYYFIIYTQISNEIIIDKKYKQLKKDHKMEYSFTTQFRLFQSHAMLILMAIMIGYISHSSATSKPDLFGKWYSDAKNYVEFGADNKFLMSQDGVLYKGSYSILQDNVIQLSLQIENKNVSVSFKYSLTNDILTWTDLTSEGATPDVKFRNLELCEVYSIPTIISSYESAQFAFIAENACLGTLGKIVFDLPQDLKKLSISELKKGTLRISMKDCPDGCPKGCYWQTEFDSTSLQPKRTVSCSKARDFFPNFLK